MPLYPVNRSRQSVTEQTLAKRERLPLHIEISEMLAREIKAGVLLDGERLEPERTMAQRLGIAVGTLRKALAELHTMGMLERVQGSGNYVRNIDANNTIYGFFRLELLDGGGLPGASTVSVTRVHGTSEITFSEKNEYYRIRRLRFLNDIDAAMEEIWLDAHYSDINITTTDLSDSLYQFYKDRLGFWIARVEDKLSVSTLPSWRPTHFGSRGIPMWGYVERKGWDQHGQQAEYSRTWFDTGTTRYIARWK